MVSILAGGKSNSTVSLRGCEWTFNSGVAAVLSYNDATVQDFTKQQVVLGKLAPPKHESMGLDFESCFFSSNHVLWAPVVSVTGDITLNSTYFVNNTGAKVGAVSISSNSTLRVSSSCFIDNKSQLPGSIFVDNTSQILGNYGNFGNNNTVGKSGECSYIFQETSGACLSTSPCNGVCFPYDSLSCKAPTFETKLESSSPSLAPSRPSIVALASPAPTAAFLSTRKLASSGIFLQTLGASLVVLGGGIVSYFYLKKLAVKA